MNTQKKMRSVLVIVFSFLFVTVGLAQSNVSNTKKTKVEKSETKEVKVPLKILKKYVGTYGVRPGTDVVITLEDNQLFGEPTGQVKVGFTPLSNTRFYLERIDGELEFEMDKKGIVTGITLYKDGREMKATRIYEE